MHGIAAQVSILALVIGVAAAAQPAAAEVNVTLEEVATGLTAPMAMVQPAGDDRMFIVEQMGRIRILQNGELQAEPFLDIRNKIVNQLSDFDERGLLGLAFHPNFAENGKFYVAYSKRHNGQGDPGRQLWWDHANVVAEYQVSDADSNVADPNYERIITSIEWPQFNHNGHWIGFGPDGFLYISTGDGGYANDWGIGHTVATGNGQDTTNLHGKILRIDVDKTEDGEAYGIPEDNPFAGSFDEAPEIYAYGMRNPWRCSFDMGGDRQLFCGDVQQNSYEEVTIIEKGGNHGWRAMEASHCFDFENPNTHPESCDKNGMVMPILEYPNCTAKPEGCKGISVTGGYVYRGSHKDWDGKYIFGDWSKSFAERDGRLFVATKGEDGKWTMDDMVVTNQDDMLGGKMPYVLAFAQDNDGEVYALTSLTTGPVGGLDSIYKIVPAQ